MNDLEMNRVKCRAAAYRLRETNHMFAALALAEASLLEPCSREAVEQYLSKLLERANHIHAPADEVSFAIETLGGIVTDLVYAK